MSGNTTLEPANAKDVKAATDELPSINQIEGESKGGGPIAIVLLVAILGVSAITGGIVSKKFFPEEEDADVSEVVDISDPEKYVHNPAEALKPRASSKRLGVEEARKSYQAPTRASRDVKGLSLAQVLAAQADQNQVKDAPLAIEPEERDSMDSPDPDAGSDGMGGMDEESSDPSAMESDQPATRITKEEQEDAARLRRQNTRLGSGIPELPPGVDESVVEMPAEREMAGDLQIDRTVFKPGVYPESGKSRDYYLTLLRNHLHRSDEAVLDLQKAYILLSMYFDPSVEPKQYREYFDGMVETLYMAITQEANADGVRELIPDPRQQLAIVTEFVQHGYLPTVDTNGVRTVTPTPYPGWDVQEYHAGVPGPGTHPADQAMLINEVFDSELMAMGWSNKGANRRKNKASSTALNLITLIMLRRLQHDLPGMRNSEVLGVEVPVYGVRLPGRTILRYNNAAGPGELMPDEDANADGNFARNIEFLRNGNHYSGRDYIRRFSISDGERASGLYLQSLHDKHFFATLGYELAKSMVERANDSDDNSERAKLYKEAQTLLDTWVLDADNGMIGMQQAYRPDGSPREAPEFPTPRGDPDLRDAYLLYADMMMQNAVAAETEGREALYRGNLETARAYFMNALEVADEAENARANYFLGEISFTLAKWSNQLRGDGEATYGEAIRRYDMAIDADLLTSALSGDERRNLFFHRAMAWQQEGDLWKSLQDMETVADLAPVFARSPAYENLHRRMKIDRAFEVLLESDAMIPNPQQRGKAKFEAVAYLGNTLTLSQDDRPDLLRCAEAFGDTGNIAAEWRLAGVLQKIAASAGSPDMEMGESWEASPDYGLNGGDWSRWLREYFETKSEEA